MKTNEKIRQLRELHEFSQEEMAEKAEMSPSGYAKIERGETRLTLERLEQFADIFNVDLSKLIQSDGDFYYQVNENTNNNGHIFNTSGNGSKSSQTEQQSEIEKLQLTLAHKDEIIAKLEEQIQDLRALNAALSK